MRCRAICLTICSLLTFISSAQALSVCGTPQQGGFVSITGEGLRKILLNGKTYNADGNGRIIMAFKRDDDLKQNLKVYYADGSMQTKILPLQKTAWDVQEVNGLPQAKVTPAKTDTAAIEKEYKAVGAGLKHFSETDFADNAMLKPVEGRTSGNFGGQRIMNGLKKNPHQGWDIAAPEGTEVKAAENGTVTLANGPFFYSGNMVILEHGHNLSTIYAHLQKVLVKKGETVKKGQVIGLVGKTGRVTGPHLHFGASLNGVRFDARNLTEFDGGKCINL